MSESFKSFLTNNGIISSAAAITVGFSTATFVKSFVADIVLPLFFMLLVKGTGKVSSQTSNFFARFLSNKEFLFANFISELVTWVLIILSAWLVIDLVYRYIIDQKPIIPTFSNPFSRPPAQETKEAYSW